MKNEYSATVPPSIICNVCICRPKRHKPTSVTVGDVEYTIVNVLGDGRCFFRCAAAFCCPDIVSASRNSAGCPHDTKLFQREAEIADNLRLKTVSFLLSHSEKLDELSSQLLFLLDNGVNCNYKSVADRLTKMSNSSEFAGLLEISALAFLAELEIEIVYKKGSKFSVHSKFWFGSLNANSVYVLRLLYDLDEIEKPGHFSLLVHSTGHMSCQNNSRVAMLASDSPCDMAGDFTGGLISLLTSLPSTTCKDSDATEHLCAQSPATHTQPQPDNQCVQDNTNTADTDNELNANKPTAGSAKQYPTVCKDYAQFNTWREKRPWLAVHPDDNSRVVCTICQQVKTSGLVQPQSVNK